MASVGREEVTCFKTLPPTHWEREATGYTCESDPLPRSRNTFPGVWPCGVETVALKMKESLSVKEGRDMNHPLPRPLPGR